MSVAPDERAVRAHLESSDFRAGLESGRWRLANVDWPFVTVGLSSLTPPSTGADFGLRCDLTGYPVVGPTATPWDIARSAMLGAGDRPQQGEAAMVFRSDWNAGLALYAPYDRVALAGHPNWATEHPRYVWDVTKTFTWFLLRVVELLDAEGTSADARL